MAGFFQRIGNFIRNTVVPVAGSLVGLGPAAPPPQVQQPVQRAVPPSAVARVNRIAEEQSTKAGFLQSKIAGIPVVLLIAGGVVAFMVFKKK